MIRPLVPLIAALSATLLFGCAGSSIGQPCVANEDCDNGQTCYLEFSGGFCGKGCTQEGSVVDCPGNTICASQGTRLSCSALCDDKSDCRGDHACNGVSSTNLKACRAQ